MSLPAWLSEKLASPPTAGAGVHGETEKIVIVNEFLGIEPIDSGTTMQDTMQSRFRDSLLSPAMTTYLPLPALGALVLSSLGERAHTSREGGLFS